MDGILYPDGIDIDDNNEGIDIGDRDEILLGLLKLAIEGMDPGEILDRLLLYSA